MSSDATNSQLGLPIKEQLARAKGAQECLELAAAADATGDSELSRACLERAVALDRFCQAALLNLAAMALNEEDAVSAFSMLEEAARVSPLPSDVEPLREQLYTAVSNMPELEQYLRLIGRIPVAPAESRLAVLVITGASLSGKASDGARDLADLVTGLRARGHTVDVLEPESPLFDSPANTRLQACGTWADGKVKPIEGEERLGRVQSNRDTVSKVVSISTPDLVLAANLDVLDISILVPVLERGVPVLHLVRTARPGFTPDDQPQDARYWIAPVSNWTGTALRNGNYETARMESVHPATPLDRFFRLFLPDTRTLRICFFASLRPASGAEVMIRALTELKQQGVAFTAELAGDAPDASFAEKLDTLVREHGLEHEIRFHGPLSLDDLPAFLARHNVLVFPPQLPDPFGQLQIQAMASGLVVVSSGTGGAKEVIRDQVDGLLFSAGSPADLAGKLSALAGNNEQMAGIQRQAQKRASVFSTENAVKQIESLAAELQSVARANSDE